MTEAFNQTVRIASNVENVFVSGFVCLKYKSTMIIIQSILIENGQWLYNDRHICPSHRMEAIADVKQ